MHRLLAVGHHLPPALPHSSLKQACLTISHISLKHRCLTIPHISLKHPPPLTPPHSNPSSNSFVLYSNKWLGVGALELVSLEQLEVLMLVVSAEEPQGAALSLRRRWRYIAQVARSARQGKVIDRSLPQVLRAPDEYLARSEAVLAALDEWLAGSDGRPACGAS